MEITIKINTSATNQPEVIIEKKDTTVNGNTAECKTEYEKACKVLGRNPLTIDAFAGEDAEDRVSCFGEHKVRTCLKALHKDATGKIWKPDFLDNSRKWYVWFIAKADKSHSSGVGFSFDASFYDFTVAIIGSRLCMKNEEIVKTMTTNPEILEYWNEWIR